MQMKINIRQEREGDCPAIHALVEAAFASMQESDHREQFLVQRLHGADTFIPQLSLVAETDGGIIVGYILLTEVEIVSEGGVVPSLAVAPLAVSPGFQNRGIGAAHGSPRQSRFARIWHGCLAWARGLLSAFRLPHGHGLRRNVPL